MTESERAAAEISVVATQDLINAVLEDAAPTITKDTEQSVSFGDNRLALTLSLTLDRFTVSIVDGAAHGSARATPRATARWRVLGHEGSRTLAVHARPPRIGVELTANGPRVMAVLRVRSLAMDVMPPELPPSLRTTLATLWNRIRGGIDRMLETLEQVINERLRHHPVTIVDCRRGLALPVGPDRTLPATLVFETVTFEGDALTIAARLSVRPTDS